MVEKIKKHMYDMPYLDKKGRLYKYGEFFPFEISPLSYNQSMVQDYFPLEKEEILYKGYLYSPINRKEFKITKKCIDLEDDISLVDDSILKEVLGCKNCSKAFKLIEKEFLFYKRFNLPIPRNCNFCRIEKLIKSVNPPRFYNRKCMKEGCNNEFETSYSPERPEIVYCEKCYQSEVY